MSGSARPASTVKAFFDAMQARDWARARSLVADDALIEWTETGERFMGQRFVDMNEAYPEGWTIDVIEVLDCGDRVAAQVRVSLAGETFWCAGFYSVQGHRIIAGTEHWVTAGSEQPPEWRRRFTDA
ncbi:MAG: nuclear transport factor 2 family protein [Pseudomonadota bacterium]